MNWEAIGAIGEITGAIAVVITLIYLASQVRHAKNAAADTNRLERSRGVREMFLESATNKEFRDTLTKGFMTTQYYEQLSERLEMTPQEAASFDWAMLYWFWLHWGQYVSTTSDSDLKELRHLINYFYRHPNVRYAWENSPWARPALETEFVRFVDEILAEEPRGD